MDRYRDRMVSKCCFELLDNMFPRRIANVHVHAVVELTSCYKPKSYAELPCATVPVTRIPMQ